MATVPSTAEKFDRGEPIPGYKTIDLLGRGGFGEVWRAIAPGGIAKAVKIVFADGDATHAETELRALARIKDVRHPLLLSIERIELVQGNLVIVTELADNSLKNHFVQLRQAQATGVPQDELLRYVTDAAEALDFLYERYSLQHLDVKPENILIVSGRAKVGDFGLVKNLYERSVSNVGGLTPTYAAPELFEGRPDRHTDQYSLAIVYMQMLTGVLPFSANNTAQLAALHLRGVPDLAALPKAQRSVIARALSKDPSQRFATCLEMVAALRESIRRPELQNPQRPADQAADAHDAAPRAAEQVSIPNTKTTPSAEHQTLAAQRNRPANPPPASACGAVLLKQDGREAPPFAPTVFVGVGGAGVEVLAKVVRRLRDRFGDSENWPPVEFLAVDTNARELSAQFQEDDLPRVQVVPIPLKPAEAYGAQASTFLKWLGRKWFYNIPRDLTTSGYRPLGRLALLTHAPRVRESITSVISKALGHAAARGTPGTAAQAAVSSVPRVVLVGSICGGTGGGALLDVAYALRGELKRRGLSDEHVHGILLHGSPRSNADRDKARANAYSTLHELDHYSAPGSHFPGEPLLGAPPFHGDNATFSRTHLLNLGDAIGEVEWNLATDRAAEFVYGVNFTPASRLLEEQEGLFPETSETSPRCNTQSYSILTLGAGSGTVISEAVRLACSDVVRLWKDGRGARSETGNLPRTDRTAIMQRLASYGGPSPADVEDAMREQLLQENLGIEDFLDESSEVIKLEVGSDLDQFLRRILDEALTATRNVAEPPTRILAIAGLLDRTLQGEAQEGKTDLQGEELYQRVVGRLNVRIRNRVQTLVESLRRLVDQPDSRIEGARQHAVAAQRLMQTVRETARKTAGALRETALAIVVAARSHDAQRPERSRLMGWATRRKSPEEQLRGAMSGYAEARLNELLHRSVEKIARIIDAELSTFVEQLDRLSRDLTVLAGPLENQARNQGERASEDELPGDAPAALAAYRPLLCGQLRQRRQEIARKIEEDLERQIVKAGHGLRRFVDEEFDLQSLLFRPVLEAARLAVHTCIREINCQLIAACAPGANAGSMSELGALLIADLCGESGAATRGVVGRIAIVPEEADPTPLVARLRSVRPGAVIVRGRHCDLTLCSVRRHASLAEVADEIISGVLLYKDLAGCLHARIDVAWRPFTIPATRESVPAFEPAASSGPMPTATIRV